MDIQSLFGVKGKTVLVTGGTRGIGFMIAEGFAANGAYVIIAARKSSEGELACKNLTSKYGKCSFIKADLAADGVDVLTREVARLAPNGLNVLVNNAGCNWAEPFDKFPKQAFQKVMTLNLESIFFLSQQLLNLLQKASRPGDPARIINVGSINGILPPTFHTFAYSSSKAALHMLTKHMALTLAPNVTVNAIAPGSFESKMMKETLETFGDAIKEANPMGRIGKREDMAAVCIWLSSAGGTYVNGAVIVVDGGAVIQQAPMAKV